MTWDNRAVGSRSVGLPVQYRMLAKEEIARRLAKMTLRPGGKAVEGDTLTRNQIAKFLGLSSYTIHVASLGDIADRTQVILSRFFTMYDDGVVRFIYDRSKGWKIEYPEEPVSRGGCNGKMKISIGKGNPTLSYTGARK